MTKKDRYPANIIAALPKRGTRLAKLSREAGQAASTLANALRMADCYRARRAPVSNLAQPLPERQQQTRSQKIVLPHDNNRKHRDITPRAVIGGMH